MKITIDTHNCHKDELKELFVYLEEQEWSYSPKKPICPRCNEFAEDIETVINPYTLEMTGEEEEEKMCGDCYENLVGDI